MCISVVQNVNLFHIVPGEPFAVTGTLLLGHMCHFSFSLFTSDRGFLVEFLHALVALFQFPVIICTPFLVALGCIFLVC